VTLRKEGRPVAKWTVPPSQVKYYAYSATFEYLSGYFYGQLGGSGDNGEETRNLRRMHEQGEFDSMSLAVLDRGTSLRTQSEIEVNIKPMLGDMARKRGMMLCAKCFYGIKKTDHATLDWWVRLHRRMGYDQLSFCYEQAEDPEGLERLFEPHADFVQVTAYSHTCAIV
jgi:hypothetical protein